MVGRIEWTADADAKLLRLRRAGYTWQGIGRALGVGKQVAIMRGAKLGLPTRATRVVAPTSTQPSLRGVNGHETMPPGHPTSWGAITAGTSLEGAPYR